MRTAVIQQTVNRATAQSAGKSSCVGCDASKRSRRGNRHDRRYPARDDIRRTRLRPSAVTPFGVEPCRATCTYRGLGGSPLMLVTPVAIRRSRRPSRSDPVMMRLCVPPWGGPVPGDRSASTVIRKQLDGVVEAAHRIFADAFEIEIAFDEVGERAG
jgi:hypothetical protein